MHIQATEHGPALSVLQNAPFPLSLPLLSDVLLFLSNATTSVKLPSTPPVTFPIVCILLLWSAHVYLLVLLLHHGAEMVLKNMQQLVEPGHRPIRLDTNHH